MPKERQARTLSALSGRQAGAWRVQWQQFHECVNTREGQSCSCLRIRDHTDGDEDRLGHDRGVRVFFRAGIAMNAGDLTR